MEFVLALHKQCSYTEKKTLYNVLSEIIPDFHQHSPHWEIKSFADFFLYDKLDMKLETFENMYSLLITNPSKTVTEAVLKLQKIIGMPRFLHGVANNELRIYVKREPMSEKYLEETKKIRYDLAVNPDVVSYRELQAEQ